MNVKELIAKFRFSHIICLGVGVLIPIYSDVLFLHEFTSSTVSAIMDTALAVFAGYAAYQVRDWLKDRVKNKGFEHAEKILTNLNQVYVLLFSLMESYKNFCYEYANGRNTTSRDEQIMREKAAKLFDESRTLHIKLTELQADINTLKSWDMECTNEDEYNNYINNCEKSRKKIDDFIFNIHDKSFMIRHAIWNRYHEETTLSYNESSEQFKSLEIRFESVFKYIPPTKTAA